MPKQIIIAEKHQVAAVFWEEQIQELVVSTGTQQVGDIYLGLVENIIPGIDAAFINIGVAEKNGFIHVNDLGPLRLRRNAGSINELLAPQQKVLVQVMKEPTGNKGPRLTGKVSLPGRYLVLIPYGRGVNLSRRIRSEEERSRLRALGVLIKPAGMGMLVRTEAEDIPEEAIIEDLEYLQKQWELIQQQAMNSRPPTLLDRDDDFIKRVLRDMYSPEVNRIVVDTASAVKRVKQQLMNWNEGQLPEGVLIDHHRESRSILEYFRVNAAIREALKPRVDLPSGGYVIIEPTEALTVIDVNSGSFTHSATSRETVLWTNYEAATEIARQLRLRNLGGVIIVDFIDMDSRRDQLKLLEHFNRCLRIDKARPQVAQLTELGLVELTRKRQGQNIYELFGQTCPQCGGLGHLVELPGEKGFVSLETPVIPVISSSTPRLVEKPIIAPPVKASGAEAKGDDGDRNDTFDLLFHPNYQEQGDVDRRRRRRRGSEVSKDDGAKGQSPSRSKTVVSDHPKDKKEKEKEKDKDTAAAPSPPSRRERPARRVEKPLVPVNVTMTGLEQELYARMGISPLLKTDYPLQEAKSYAVSVFTPDEKPGETAAAVQEIRNGNPISSPLTPTPEAKESTSREESTVPPTDNGSGLTSSALNSEPPAPTTPPLETKKRPGRRRRRPSAES
ncbi:MAG: Rne/Rng family ribonuclease [Synechocystis sp.]|nr:Rne/Rng family ribonuclease [Synechocystis sp.]